MKKNVPRKALALVSLVSLGAGIAGAQTAPTPPPAASNQESDDLAIVMDPFTVTTEHEGYKADDTLAGGRVRTELKDTPSSLSVVTARLMQDLGVVNAEGLLNYTNNTEVSGLGGNFSGISSRGSGISISSPAEGTRLVNPAGVNRARGLSAMDNTRNYFLSDIPWDGYNISRVDISRGPNSFLFGQGSPAGISNVSTNDASFKTQGHIESRYGSFGSTRESLDYNRVLLPKELAIRVDLVNDDAKFEQKPAFNHTQRAYASVRFDPKFLDFPSAHTKILVSGEHGQVVSNNPRMVPPIDYITGYLKDSRASATGYNPWLYTFNDGGSDPTGSAWAGNGSIGNEYQWGNAVTYYWDAPTGKILRAGQSGFSAPTGANYGAAGAGLSNIYHVHTNGFSGYTRAVNYANPDGQAGTLYPGAYKGTVTYLDQTLSDPSVYDFYTKLIDGNNKREWQRWNAYNVSLVQSLFNDRLTIQAAADHQEYSSGSEGFLGSRTPVLLLDLDSYLLTYPSWLTDKAQANPNLGRPLTFGSSGSGNRNTSKRENYQVTAAYNLNVRRDFGTTGMIGKLLGTHEVTVLGGSYDTLTSSEGYRLYGIDPAWTKANTGGVKLADNGTNFTAYLGSSVLGTSGAGANLSNLAFSIAPVPYSLTAYNKMWNASANVSPTADWSFTGPNNTAVTLTQADNPSNYVGYQGLSAATLDSKKDMDYLRTGSSMNRHKITSKALMYQGKLWDGMVIPSFGYRQDTTKQSGSTALPDNTTGLISKVERITDSGVSATTTSSSYGVAVHLPAFLKRRMPEGTDVTMYYFHGENEKPLVRYAIDGSQLNNEKGRTNDYSIQFDGFNNHLTARLTYFKTEVANSSASYGQPLGTNGWFIDALPSWTLGMAGFALAARETPEANRPADWPTWANGWFTDWAVAHASVADQIANVLKTDFVKMYPQSFWDTYGYLVDVEAIKRGDWLHVSKAAGYPSPWTFAGNHTIHGQYAVIDQNTEAKGYELEITYRPIKNWDITFNGSKANATQTSLGAAATNYLNGMAKLWLDTPLGKTAMWGSYTDYGSMKQAFMQNLWAPYLQQMALTGSDQPEWRKLKFNIISNYKFDSGRLKGLKIGGAYRWEDKAILGYHIHQAEVYGEQGWIANVQDPIYGPSLHHFDCWVGYEHRLNSSMDWSVQFNVTNVGEKRGLEVVSYQPALPGQAPQVAQQRITNGAIYNATFGVKF